MIFAKARGKVFGVGLTFRMRTTRCVRPLNSGETARALCLFNTLLGCWNQPGGALFLPSVKAGDLDPVKFPEVPKPAAKRLGDAEYPLRPEGTGITTTI